MTNQPQYFDHHVHTNFSPDSTTPMEAYAQAANQLAIHVGFLDHFEIAFTNRPGYLNENSIPSVLETFDDVHALFPNTSLSLEIDYYSHLDTEVREFCDDYRKSFDYLIGTVHCIDGLATTIPGEMQRLVQQLGLKGVLERYFHEVEAAIHSGLFDGIAHIDSVMRFIPTYPNFQKLLQYWQKRTNALCLLCRDQHLLIEVNLQGIHYPWGQTHPSFSMVRELAKAGAKFFVGSDSHTLEDFLKAEPRVKQTIDMLRRDDAFRIPDKLG
jgi:histidinol-phosphatase (PHP family)